MRIGYFCTAGYTETGGIRSFLEKISPDIEWERCFPAVDKPGPKFKRAFAEPRREDSGVTGQSLVDRMLERLRKYHHGDDCKLDLVLLIDDADCRFKEGKESFAEWTAARQAEVREATGKSALEFLVLLASPEVEAWLLTDWEEGFGREYPSIEQALREHLEQHLLGPRPWTAIEDYGGRYEHGSCEHKLSEDVQQVFSDLLAAAKEGSIDQAVCFYSKKLHGAPMLYRIRPDELCSMCTRYFLPVYEQLRALKPSAPTALTPPVKAHERTRKRQGGPAVGDRRTRPKPRS